MSKNHELTAMQSKLWHLAETEMASIAQKDNREGFMGGYAALNRNKDKTIRDKTTQKGTREWALCETIRLRSPGNDEYMNDEYCQYLIDCIKNKK